MLVCSSVGGGGDLIVAVAISGAIGQGGGGGDRGRIREEGFAEHAGRLEAPLVGAEPPDPYAAVPAAAED